MEPRGQIIETIDNDMDDAFLALQFAGAPQQCRAERGAAEAFENFGQMIRLAILVSSSIVMNTTALALPGRWRISTRPAIDSRRSTRQVSEIGGGHPRPRA